MTNANIYYVANQTKTIKLSYTYITYIAKVYNSGIKLFLIDNISFNEITKI